MFRRGRLGEPCFQNSIQCAVLRYAVVRVALCFTPAKCECAFCLHFDCILLPINLLVLGIAIRRRGHQKDISNAKRRR